jgi:hypothetical protein
MINSYSEMNLTSITLKKNAILSNFKNTYPSIGNIPSTVVPVSVLAVSVTA